MRRFALALFIAAASPLLMGAGQQAPARHVDLSDSDQAELDGISAYLNGLTTLRGTFLQTQPGGRIDQGKFYILKPGKLRFEYRPPSPTLIVSDGRRVAVANIRLNTVDTYSLKDTPLAIVLDNKIDIRHDPQLVSVEHQQGEIIIHMRTSSNRTRANLALVFTEPNYQLVEWSVVDNQGQTTIVALRDQQAGVALDPALFDMPQRGHLTRPPG